MLFSPHFYFMYSSRLLFYLRICTFASIVKRVTCTYLPSRHRTSLIPANTRYYGLKILFFHSFFLQAIIVLQHLRINETHFFIQPSFAFYSTFGFLSFFTTSNTPFPFGSFLLQTKHIRRREREESVKVEKEENERREILKET